MDTEKGLAPERFASMWSHHELHVATGVVGDQPDLAMISLVGAYNGRDFSFSYHGISVFFTGPQKEAWRVGHKSHEPRIVFDPTDFDQYYVVRSILGQPLLTKVTDLIRTIGVGTVDTDLNEWLYLMSQLKHIDARAEPVVFHRSSS